MIDLNKKYKTRGGLDVIIYAIHPEQRHPVHGAIKTSNGWEATAWREDGSYYNTFGTGPHDLVEYTPYSEFKIDDPIIVWETPNVKHRRHFAGLSEDGLVMTFNYGKTSWSNNPDSTPTKWKNACLPSEADQLPKD